MKRLPAITAAGLRMQKSVRFIAAGPHEALPRGDDACLGPACNGAPAHIAVRCDNRFNSGPARQPDADHLRVTSPYGSAKLPATPSAPPTALSCHMTCAPAMAPASEIEAPSRQKPMPTILPVLGFGPAWLIL